MTFLRSYLRLARFDKPAGSLLLLWPVLWALWLAYDGPPPVRALLLFVAGVIVTRALGCVLNDMVDKTIDSKVTRTRSRPLAVGELTMKQAWFMVVILACCAALVLWCLQPSLLWFAVLCLVSMGVYPSCKRWLAMPQMFLAYVFSLGIPFVFLYVRHSINMTCLMLFAINYLWVLSYDTYYAIVDKTDDLQIGVQSTAVYWGDHASTYILTCQLTMALLWLLVFIQHHLSLASYALLAIAQGYLLWLWYRQQQSPSTEEGSFRAFSLSHWYGAIVWVSLVAG